MSYYITGSVALHQTFQKSFWRKVADQDFLASQEYFDSFVKKAGDKIVLKKETERGYTLHVLGYDPLEFEICEPGTTGHEFLDIRKAVRHKDSHHLSPYEVGLFKLSHRYRKNSAHFNKTMDDIHQLRSRGWLPRAIPAKSAYSEWLKKREKETLSYKHPNLSVEKNNFFRKDTGIEYIFDHDTIHEAVAVGLKPAYTHYIAEGETVKTDKQRFFDLPREIQLLGPLEESYVLALERHQIPNNFKPDPFASFKIALMKVCTSITSGWFREFSWENYRDILALYNGDYIDKFKAALEAGRIAPYTGQ